MLTVQSTINIAGQTVPQVIPVVQGDSGRSILFTLADYTIPTGSTASVYILKPSGDHATHDASVTENKVQVDLEADDIDETGDNYGQIRLTDDDQYVTSFDFILSVETFRGTNAVIGS